MKKPKAIKTISIEFKNLNDWLFYYCVCMTIKGERYYVKGTTNVNIIYDLKNKKLNEYWDLKLKFIESKWVEIDSKLKGHVYKGIKKKLRADAKKL